MFNRIINKIFKKFIDKKVNELMYIERNKAGEERKQLEMRNFKDEWKIGEKVIIRSNEWQNLIVGEIVDYEEFNDCVVPIVYDIISEKKIFSNSLMKHYNFHLLEMLMQHNPYEQYCLMAKGLYGNSMLNKKINVLEEIKTLDEIVEIIKKNNF